jgi:predicted enzyme related to lactoylglutathione lyase
MASPPKPVVHLELHTGDLRSAQATYEELCGWRQDRIETAHGSYVALQMGGGVGGGIVECPTTRPLWLPYVLVDDIFTATQRARQLGAAVVIDAREGPVGWRSVITSPTAGEIALWQQKR